MAYYVRKWLVFLIGVWIGALGALFGFSLLTRTVAAATYNVFFNNVEQGHHGVASPTLTVPASRMAPTSAPEAGSEAPNTLVPAPAATVAPASLVRAEPSDGASSVRLRSDLRTASEDHPLRLTLAATSLGADTAALRADGGRHVGGQLGLMVFPLRDLGLGGFAGTDLHSTAYYGAELEIVPVRIGIFGLPSFVEASALLGASTLGKDAALPATGHAGAKVAVNLDGRYGIAGTIRTNFTDRDRYAYVMADAGLVVRF